MCENIVWDSLKFVVTRCIFIEACRLHQWLSRQKVIQNERHLCYIFDFLKYLFWGGRNWCLLITSCRKHEADCLAIGIHLISKGLWWIVDDDGLWQISAQDVEVFDVVSLDTDTMLAKQPVSKVTVREWEDRDEREKNQSVTRSEQSIIQKNHNTDTSTAAHANTNATYSFLTPFYSASEFVA